MAEVNIQVLLGEVLTQDSEMVMRILLRHPEEERESLLSELVKASGIHKKFWEDKLREFGQRLSAKK